LKSDSFGKMAEENSMQITSSFAYHYVLTTVSFSSIRLYLIEYSKGALVAAYLLIVSTFKLLICLCLVIAKISILGFPHAIRMLKIVIKFHRTQLSWTDIMLEFSALFCVIFCITFRRKIAELWRRIEIYLIAKSRLVATAAPHVIFFSVAFLFAILGKKFIVPFTSSNIMPIFTLIIPLLTTWNIFYHIHCNLQVERNRMIEGVCGCLEQWMIIGVYHTLVTLASLIPFSQYLLQFLPYLKEIIIVNIIWIQLSRAFKKTILEFILYPIMKLISTYLPILSNYHSTEGQRSMIIIFLKTMRILKDSYVDFIGKLLHDSVVTIVASIIIFLPNPFAAIGMVVIACLLPSFRTTTVVEKLRRRRLDPTTSTDNTPNEEFEYEFEYSFKQAKLWLSYWICFSVLWIFRIYILKVWSSIVIAFTMWLQHSFFHGSIIIVTYLVEIQAVILTRNLQSLPYQPIRNTIEVDQITENSNEDGIADLQQGPIETIQEADLINANEASALVHRRTRHS
jgi:hypothetical protein